jgi:O-antigen/teichoic acid export membrane protein
VTSVAGDSAWRAASSALSLVTSLAIGILTARLLGPSGKGELYLLMQTASMGALLLALGLGPSYQYHVTKGILPRGAVNAHVLAQTVLVAVVVTGIWFFARPLLRAVTHDAISTPLLRLTCVAIVLNVFLLFVQCLVNSLPNGIRNASILSGLASILNLLLLMVLVWAFRQGTPGAALAWLASLGLQLALGVYWILAGAMPDAGLQWLSHTRRLYGYGMSFLAGNLMVTTVFRIDVFLVNGMLGPAPLGIYSVAVAFAELVLLVPNAIGTVLFAHLPAMDEQDQIGLLARSSRMTVLISLVVGLGVAAISYPLVVVLMGARFAGAVVPLCALVPGLIAMSANYVFANYFGAHGRPLVTAGCFLVGSVLNIAANLALIPALGILGAAIASTIAYAAITATFYLFLRRHIHLGFRRLFVPGSEEWRALRSTVLSLKNRLNAVLGRVPARAGV